MRKLVRFRRVSPDVSARNTRTENGLRKKHIGWGRTKKDNFAAIREDAFLG